MNRMPLRGLSFTCAACVAMLSQACGPQMQPRLHIRPQVHGDGEHFEASGDLPVGEAGRECAPDAPGPRGGRTERRSRPGDLVCDPHSVLPLAATEVLRGCYSSARLLLRDALATCHSDLGVDHPETQLVNEGLARVLFMDALESHREGRYSRAASLFRRSLELREAYPEDLLSSRIRRALAVTYLRQDRGTDAQWQLLRALDTVLRLHGNEHEDTLRISEDLAVAYMRLNNASDARGILEHVLDERRRLLGDEHPDTVRVFVRLRGLRGL